MANCSSSTLAGLATLLSLIDAAVSRQETLKDAQVRQADRQTDRHKQTHRRMLRLASTTDDVEHPAWQRQADDRTRRLSGWLSGSE